MFFQHIVKRSAILNETVTNISNEATTAPPDASKPAHVLRAVDYLSLIFLGLLVIMVIAGNLLVILSFATVGRKIRNVTNYFVVSLAVSDILVGIFSIPFWMIVQIRKSLLNFIVIDCLV